MQDALSHLQHVINVEVSLPNKAIIKVQKNAITENELANVIKAAGFDVTTQ